MKDIDLVDVMLVLGLLMIGALATAWAWACWRLPRSSVFSALSSAASWAASSVVVGWMLWPSARRRALMKGRR
jgi:hypothetical protein